MGLPQTAVAEISGVREAERWRRACALWVTVTTRIGSYHKQKGVTVNKPRRGRRRVQTESKGQRNMIKIEFGRRNESSKCGPLCFYTVK